MGVLCLSVAALLVLLLHTMTGARTTRDQLNAAVKGAESQALQHEATIKRLEAQVADLVCGRLPWPLRPLQTDTIVELAEPPLRSILITQVGSPGHPSYEYRLKVQNDSRERVDPKLRVLFFNAAGVQIGGADVRDSDEMVRPGAAGLPPGEAALFSGRVTLEIEDRPAYFLVLAVASAGRLVPPAQASP